MGLTAADVTEFVLWQSRRCAVGYAKAITTRLRCLLRFLHVEGLTPNTLAAAVPSVAGWRLTGLPEAISASDVARLLRSCDRRRAIGRRDFAILKALARLGLRAGEVAALQLEDIDWRVGEVTVRGKGNREDRLPLPHDVGEAIAGWLRYGRPRCACRALFTRVLAPHRGLSSRGVSTVVRQACGRAGLPPVGAHRLRHCVATQMLGAGANLAEVGQVLRHHSLTATSIYAKVDRRALSAVVQPWPVGAP
jgi:integrase